MIAAGASDPPATLSGMVNHPATMDKPRVPPATTLEFQAVLQSGTLLKLCVMLGGQGTAPPFLRSRTVKRALTEVWQSFSKLLRFVFWYAVGVAIVFRLLPLAGSFLEDRYDTLSASVRFFTVIGFFAVVAAWEIRNRRRRQADMPRSR